MQSKHVSIEQLQAGVDHIRRSPADQGVLRLIARRPDIGKRELLRRRPTGPGRRSGGRQLEARGASYNPPREPNPLTQLTIMNARSADLVATCRSAGTLAGDQLYIDLDLSPANLPAGTHLAIGAAVVQVTTEPHTGCKNFVKHFGLEAMMLVNGPEGRSCACAASIRGWSGQASSASETRWPSSETALTQPPPGCLFLLPF